MTITDHLWGQSTGQFTYQIQLCRALMFMWCQPEQAVDQSDTLPVIWDAMTLIRHYCYEHRRNITLWNDVKGISCHSNSIRTTLLFHWGLHCLRRPVPSTDTHGFRHTHFSFDDCEVICTSSYCYHQIVYMNHELLFSVSSLNDGMCCMYCYVLF